MIKIQYADLINFIRSIDKIKNLRLVYQSNFRHPEIYLYGENGLLTNWGKIYNFYSSHLYLFNVFNKIIESITNTLNLIKQEDVYNGIINKVDYKEIILSICIDVENLESLTYDIFSNSTLLQFFSYIFQPDTLMYRLNLLYPEEQWDFIPDESKKDIQEGAKGLIVGTPTASAFMFLRALEGCLRKLYTALKGEPVKKANFNAVLSFLEEYYLNDNNEEINRQLKFLKYIKDEFRNPSAHPEKHFSQNEAEQLFQVVNVAISRIYYLYKIAPKD